MIAYAIIHAACAVVMMWLLVLKFKELTVLDVFASVASGPLGLFLFVIMCGERVIVYKHKERTK